MLKNTKIALFKPISVILVHGRPDIVTDVGKNGLMRFRPFTNLCDYFNEPFPPSDIGQS